jgi:hypothetical protein
MRVREQRAAPTGGGLADLHVMLAQATPDSMPVLAKWTN